jgi:dipeptidyl aminopeptidase/acylaminoacyl peptidase
MIHHRIPRAALLLLSSAMLTACKDATSPPPPTTGTISLDVTTTGVDIDPDGYRLSVDGGDPQAMPASGSVNWIGGSGAHTIAISGLAFNCDLTTQVAGANVTLGQTTRVAIGVTCTPYLRGAIVYASEAFGFPEIMVMRTDGSRPTRLTTDQAVYTNPAVSPDGQAIVVDSRLGGSWSGLYLLDRFGQSRKKIVDRPAGVGGAAWSPDGTKLAIVGFMPGGNGDYARIFVVNRDGTGLRQVTPETASYSIDTSPSWSPDGTRIFYSHFGELWVINADGTGATSLGVSGQYPALSPDGRQIAYTSVSGVQTTMIADASGANARPLTTPSAGGDQYPRWSPDGRRIVFQRVEGTTLQLYVMMADGTGVTKLSAVAQSEYAAGWSPTS